MHRSFVRWSFGARRVVVSAVVAFVAAALTTGVSPSAMVSAAPECRGVELPVALSPGTQPNLTVSGTLCAAKDGRDVEVLTHGFTYGRSYWDFGYQPETYSYVRRANEQGRATFNYDRIGVGGSSHPPAADVTIESNAYVLHQIVQALRAGAMGFQAGNVITVGHSLGSLISMAEAGACNDVDGVVLSGISHSFVTAGVALLVPDLVPTQLDPVLAPRGLPLGYLTTRVGSREARFYYSPTADPQVVALDEATKESGTAGEVSTLPTALPFSETIHAPVRVINGDRDQLICGLILCSSPLSPFRTEHTFYPSAASYSEVLLPATGHDIALQTTAPAFAAAVDAWIDAHA
jgi:pimeloyl-ACP methyl ester carboxylesterase